MERGVLRTENVQTNVWMLLEHQGFSADDHLLSAMPCCTSTGGERHAGFGGNSRGPSVSSVTEGTHGAETPFRVHTDVGSYDLCACRSR